jgi:hypothetical protein
VAAADDDRCDQGERDQRQRRDAPPGPRVRPAASPRFGLRAREVRDERVEVGVGLRLEALLEALLELGGVEASLQVALPEDLRDRIAFAVADAQRAVVRPAAPVVTVLVLCRHRLFSFVGSGVALVVGEQ